MSLYIVWIVIRSQKSLIWWIIQSESPNIVLILLADQILVLEFQSLPHSSIEWHLLNSYLPTIILDGFDLLR